MVTADQIGRMLNRQPSVVSYKSAEDLIKLKDWFYNFDEHRDHRHRAVQIVKAISSRGRIPHAIESTSLLTSLCLSDPEMSSKSSPQVVIQKDSYLLQLSYSMALTRFVNGLLDPLQQSNFAIPLHQLAKSLQMPSYFVELRHTATHEKLPSLALLRTTAKNALNWLYDNYWNKIEDIESDIEDEVEELLSERDQILIQDAVKASDSSIKELVANLKVYKKIRKQDLNFIYKFGNSSDTGKKYWKAVSKIKSILASNPQITFRVLIFKDFLIYNKMDPVKAKKINSFLAILFKLYNPLLEELGPYFKRQLYEVILRSLKSEFTMVETQINKKLGFEITHEYETTQLCGWVVYLYSSMDDQGKKRIGSLLQDISSLNDESKMEILQGLNKIELLEDEKQQVEVVHESVGKRLKLKKYEQVESLDSILGTQAPALKKQKIQPSDDVSTSKKTYFFEPHAKWTATPFGSSV
ncbi:Las1-domain-containing protein [Yamadazyma tenuis ATCC 10573]|uniref:Las1-domain-containing protein n=2 Tax=Candida tenuis TaxID=2315449 RepID=G3B2J1_CANTC|nr:Las1-domain-containing protein [Yamadazyma tenuis ATCC 10573]EGV64689.1 Las1-domain-containing protein [Yamadazyma tenuis ATCC 10573]